MDREPKYLFTASTTILLNLIAGMLQWDLTALFPVSGI
jgi:hypothetical protein